MGHGCLVDEREEHHCEFSFGLFLVSHVFARRSRLEICLDGELVYPGGVHQIKLTCFGSLSVSFASRRGDWGSMNQLGSHCIPHLSLFCQFEALSENSPGEHA